MDATATIVVAVVTALGTVTVGYFTLRATVKAAQAKEKVDENATALTAWRELVQPLRDEVARLVVQIEREREEHTEELFALKREHAAVLAALEPLNDEISKSRRREGKK